MTIKRWTAQTRAVILAMKAANRPVYRREIASALGLTSGSVAPMLRRLSAAGYVTGFWEDPADRARQIAHDRKRGRALRRYYILTELGKTGEQ